MKLKKEVVMSENNLTTEVKGLLAHLDKTVLVCRETAKLYSAKQEYKAALLILNNVLQVEEKIKSINIILDHEK